jgi:hypothetical protein
VSVSGKSGGMAEIASMLHALGASAWAADWRGK